MSDEPLEVSESSSSGEVVPFAETQQTGVEQSQHIEISSSGQVEDSTEQEGDDTGDGLVEEGAMDYGQDEGTQEGTVSQGENEEPQASEEAWNEDVPERGDLPETTESEQTAGDESDSELVVEEQRPISGSDAAVTEPQASQSSAQVNIN